MKIIIVGAGIAGLTFGLACHRAGIDVTIYDKAKELRNIGGGILLWPHGVRYLKWLGLSDCLAPFQVTIHNCNIISNSGQKIFSENCSTLYSLLDGEILPVDRGMLQQTLLAQLPSSILKLGKDCVAIQENPNKASIHFAEGSSDDADLIVGADGIFSTVRTYVNASATLEYTNHCWWGGIIDRKDIPYLDPTNTYVALGIRKTCIIWPASNEKIMWYLPVKMPVTELTSDKNGLPQLKSICENWSDTVKQIISATSNGKNFHLPIHTLPPQSTWTKQRVVLIGDAAHTLGPILAQGASMAIEDAFVLLNCLKKNTHTIPEILKHYETLRRDKYESLSRLETQTAAMFIPNNHEELEIMQQQMEFLDLVTMYKEVIPLVNEEACLRAIEV
jgi:2-polyprenyl-6-methoxyphenol hydroxylase-like FAD-dependent oxidoreductase